jgi:DNA-binding response OmpR family regulator
MKKILLIEDNDDIRNNTAEILELSNYRVIVAENGKTGVEKALEHLPDLIICDIMMPLLDGYGVLHAVHKNDNIKNTPFIFLTARTERSDFRKGMELGADDYITKPFNGTELLNAVDSRLRKNDSLKKDLYPVKSGITDMMDSPSKKDALIVLTEGRNTNKYKKKQTIYSKGNHPNRLYYILSGKVKIFKTNEDGKNLVTDLFCHGDFIGHIALLEGSIYNDTAEAMEDTELAIIPKEDFEELLNTNTEVAKKIIQLLAKNVSEKEEQLIGLAYNSLRKKVAKSLLLIQSKYNQEENEHFVIDISRESLSTIAGTATESLIRTLSDFRFEKIVEIVDGKITIINQQKLELMIS